MKKSLNLISGVLALLALLISADIARAAAPTLTLSTTGSGDYVEIDVSGTAGYNVLMNYQKTSGGNWMQALGTIPANGSFSTQVSTATYNISPNSVVYVTVNNQQSNSVTWPYNTTTGGAITFNQTGSVLTVGQTITLTANNVGSNLLYLLNNTNPQIANISISSNQITISANTYGQTVVTVCALGTTTNCASDYVTVQNTGAQALTFSQSNLTVASGQNSTVTILNGTNGTNATGNYTILNNSNPSVISSSISGATITLNALGNNGTASLTVCSTDMSSCGIINASAGATSSTGLTFSQTAPTLLIGQTLSISMSGGGSTYNISTNSNSAVVAASITSTNYLTLVGNGVGSAVVTVCSSSGNCGSITATVSYATSGPITLSQNNLWLQVGQAASVLISGGTMPYSILNNASSSSFVQSSLNNNILSLTGIAAGNVTLSVCSAGGACTQLSALVNGVSTSGQLTFSNNNLSMLSGNNATVSLYGNGGYYISNSTNQNVATITLSGSQLSVAALTAGSASATVCQTSGQCSVLYASVSSNTPTATPPTFSPSNPTVTVGQMTNINLSGGSSSNYYVSSNSNPSIAQASISGSNLSLSGLQSGSSVIVVCAASNNCGSLSVTVNNYSTPTVTPPASNPANNPSNNSGNAVSANPAATILQTISTEAGNLAGGNVNAVLGGVSANRNLTLESSNFSHYISPLLKNTNLSQAASNNLNYFVSYGSPSTLKLGAGERAGVLSSYQQAYGKLPVTAAEWSDLIKIGNGRWPTELSQTAMAQAKIEFSKVYNRSADMNNSKDANAITIIAYGLRPTARNTASEKAAILSFRAVYGHPPVNPLAWNIVRAIAYSGAAR